MLRLGVIGAGYWGPNLIRNFASLEDVSLERIADLDATALAKLKETYPKVDFTTNPDDVLGSNLDAICIATSAHTHYELAKKALLAGKHVFCEKPLTLKACEAEDLVEISEKKNLKLMVGHLMLYHPAVRKLKALIDSGKLGQVFYVNSMRVNLGIARSNENALWSLTPHDLSIILYLFGKDTPVGVSATGKDFLTQGVEDIVFVSLYFNGNQMAHVRASWLDPEKIRRVKVTGSRGIAIFDDVGKDSVVKFLEDWIEPKGNGDFSYHKTNEAEVFEVDKLEPLRLECEHFVECVLQGKKPLTDGLNGARVVAILERAEESLKEKGAYKSL